MPRKRKVTAETGNIEAQPEAQPKESAPKTSRRSRSAESSPRKVTDGAKKPRAKRTSAATPRQRTARTQGKAVAIQTKPVNATQPGPVAAATESIEVTSSSAVPIREQIAQLAYSYWEARGFQHGDPEEDWYRAEREILGRLRTEDSQR